MDKNITCLDCRHIVESDDCKGVYACPIYGFDFDLQVGTAPDASNCSAKNDEFPGGVNNEGG